MENWLPGFQVPNPCQNFKNQCYESNFYFLPVELYLVSSASQ